MMELRLPRGLRPAALVLGAAGFQACAVTEIDFPMGNGETVRYRSTRDTDVGGLRVELTRPDGTKTLVVLDSAGGYASPVDAVLWQGVAEIVGRALAAARGAVP